MTLEIDSMGAKYLNSGGGQIGSTVSLSRGPNFHIDIDEGYPDWDTVPFSTIEIVPDFSKAYENIEIDTFEVIGDLRDISDNYPNDPNSYPVEWINYASRVSMYTTIEYNIGPPDFTVGDLLNFETTIPISVDFNKFNLDPIDFGSRSDLSSSEKDSIYNSISIDYDIDYYNGSSWINCPIVSHGTLTYNAVTLKYESYIGLDIVIQRFITIYFRNR